MTPVTLRQLLANTLKDAVQSHQTHPRTDHNKALALQTILAKFNQTPEQQDKVRQIAFELAEAAIDQMTAQQADTPKTDIKKVLKWLSQVTELLVQPAPQSEIAEAWFSPFHDCVSRIVQLFDQSQQQIDICVFTITDNRITDAILDAHRRGITIRIISDNDKAFDRGSDIEFLQSKGVGVRVDATAFHMHHKFAVFDQKILLTGSYNWTVGAARDNQENFVITPDRRLIQAYRTEFDRLWQNLA